MKYMGIIVTSHNMKKRNMSKAVKTTIMAPSTRRTSPMKALTLVSITFHDAKTQRGISSVVSNTSRILIPSTPTAYSILNVVIHSDRSTNCMPFLDKSNPDQSTPVSPRLIRVPASATRRTHWSPRINRSTPMVRNGTAIIQLIR